ncbi:hypothetical protein JQX13_39915 [Archangium violaceum]|uniref:hypothetical protein n=1 Tax=Archangium violaceum TaxID=83451 RepID=UPI00193B54B2|nr:hypothetical protein [Archangium violaceum]QRK06228.1 hypothetical protein JQX13_39915 [Archangium violaceum]
MGAACDMTPLVDRHFAASISPEDERQMRAHVTGCATCRDRYTRLELLARLDPRAPKARERLARGLGFSSSAATTPSTPWLPALTVLAAACVALLLVRVPGVREDAAFTPRGGEAVAEPALLVVYAVGRDGSVAPVGDRVRPEQELAFGYRNPEAKRFLMVFGVDSAGRVHWYFPSWTVPEEDPTALPISPGDELHELPEAISHPLAPGHLSVHAIFLDVPLTVRQMEERLGAAGSREVTTALPEGALHTTLELQVTP